MRVAVVAAWMRRLDEAFAHLEQSYAERDARRVAITSWPMCRPLWDASPHEPFLERLGLSHPRG